MSKRSGEVFPKGLIYEISRGDILFIRPVAFVQIRSQHPAVGVIPANYSRGKAVLPCEREGSSRRVKGLQFSSGFGNRQPTAIGVADAIKLAAEHDGR